jgi:hypothetical protein
MVSQANIRSCVAAVFVPQLGDSPFELQIQVFQAKLVKELI